MDSLFANHYDGPRFDTEVAGYGSEPEGTSPMRQINEQTTSITARRNELVEHLLELQDRLAAHVGRGKGALVKARNEAATELLAHLQAKWGLTEDADISDALDFARRNTPLASINGRYLVREDERRMDEDFQAQERELLETLAAKYGYRLVKEDTAVELTVLTEQLYRRAKERQASWGQAGGGSTSGHLLDLNHARDDMADLRSALIHADVINLIP